MDPTPFNDTYLGYVQVKINKVEYCTYQSIPVLGSDVNLICGLFLRSYDEPISRLALGYWSGGDHSKPVAVDVCHLVGPTESISSEDGGEFIPKCI